jgi:sigma-B regulation protein RsbU (phosphoserine phosphatase)
VEEPDPGAAITRLNRALCSFMAEAPILVTLFYAVLDLKTGQVAYANAGHPPGFVVDSDGRLAELTSTGGMLGVEPTWEWRSVEARLDLETALILFTDGITEARRGETFFGEDGAARCVLQEANRREPDFAGALCEEVTAFSGSNLRDDVAVVALRRLPGSGLQHA